VDRAVARIQRLRLAGIAAAKPPKQDAPPKDALQKVQFIDCAWRTVDTLKASAVNGKPRRQLLN